MSGGAARFFGRLAALQVRRFAVFLFVAALVTGLAARLATGLTLETGFDHLLPDARPSVLELHRVAKSTAGVSTLFIVVESRTKRTPPTKALRDAADALVPEIEKIGPPWIGSVEDGVFEARRFLLSRAGLYADLGALRQLDADVDARYKYEVSKQLGMDLGDPPPPIDEETLTARFKTGGLDGDRFPDGYYQSKDGRAVVVAIRSKVLGTDLDNAREVMRRVNAAIARADLKRFDASITTGFAGDLWSGMAEVTAVNKDLTEVGITGAIAIAVVVLLYYLRVRTLVVMLMTMLVGVVWTFGVARLAVGNLNMATGFMFTIVAGNGINAGIIYMARYLEARRDKADVGEAIRVAHVETWLATLTAAAAAAASYASLGLTEFRGFRDFGLIGSVGMMLCWVATHGVLPALLVATERVLPIEREHGLAARARAAWGAAFGRPVAAVVARAPRAIAGLGVALALVGVAAAIVYVRRDPMEYDLNNLRNERGSRAEEERVKHISDAATGYVGADGMAILVDRPDQVAPLRKELYARRDAVPAALKPFAALHALEDFVPAQQAEKIPVLLHIKSILLKAHVKGAVSDPDWHRLQEALPPDDLKPFGMAEMPVALARPFTEVDGTRGRIVYISPTSGDLVEDAHYLLRWADAYREAKLPDGSVVIGSGRAVIYADMWAAVVAAVPRAITFSLLATILVVALAFRGRSAALLVIGALLVGVAWVALAFFALGVHINFLNFVALPITFGIGVDYAVNIAHRYDVERSRGLPTGDAALVAVRQTGGAVILCSATTTLGYLALVRSMNFAVRSLGVAAVLGEACCLLAAVFVLPAVLVAWSRRAR